jgi:hypothetical protein
MAISNLLTALMTAGAGAAALFALEPQDQPGPAYAPAPQQGYAQPTPVAQYDSAPDACWLDVTSDPYGGRMVSAWAAPGFDGAYRLVMTRRTGGGGFDIVQEGAIESWADDGGPLSEVWVGDEERFSARYHVYDASGGLICERYL